MFEEFPKMARLSRGCVISEKIDGTNAQIFIASVIEDGYLDRLSIKDMRQIGDYFFAAGSRTRFITPEDDNFGFARWAYEHADELIAGLGVGRHYGEWWGSGIQRGYGLPKGEKRFSLFNTARWADNRDREKFPSDRPACCHVVPVLFSGEFSTEMVGTQIERLRTLGSVAAPGFDKPEGVVVWHEAARVLFKKTLEKDAEGKEQKARRLAHEASK